MNKIVWPSVFHISCRQQAIITFLLATCQVCYIPSLVTHVCITKVYMHFLFAVLQIPPADHNKAECKQRHRGYVQVPSVPLHPRGNASGAS